MLKEIIAVDQYDKKGNFLAHYESLADASGVVGITTVSIIKACRGINMTGGGYIWKYSDPERAAKVVVKSKKVDKQPVARNLKNEAGNISGYQDLAIAIIQSVANDYKAVLKILKRRPDLVRRSNVKELERFFHSDWYKTLTSVDGDYIINKIKEEVAEEKDDD